MPFGRGERFFHALLSSRDGTEPALPGLCTAAFQACCHALAVLLKARAGLARFHPGTALPVRVPLRAEATVLMEEKAANERRYISAQLSRRSGANRRRSMPVAADRSG